MVWPTFQDLKLDEFDAMELPGQQLTSAYAGCQLDYTLNLDLLSHPGCQRLTAIMAAMGKSTANETIMENMIGAGMNIALLNLCFSRKEEHIENIKMLRKAAKAYSAKMDKNYPLCIAARLSGKKIRTGQIADTYGDEVELRTGDVVRLTTDETYRDRCSMYVVYVDFMNFATQVKVGDYIMIDNEIIEIRVESINPTTIVCKVEKGDILGSYKDVYVPNVKFDMPNYSERDKMYIDMAVSQQLDILIASFVNNATAIYELKNLLADKGDKGKKILVFANIQTMQAFDNFDEILQAADGIMITRQELGSDITPKKLVLAQKNMIARANTANVPVFVNAQLLQTMRSQKLPLRSELMDIGNCVLDGADGLVLSAETAVGLYPVEAVAQMANTCKESEACIWTKQLFTDLVDHTAVPCELSNGLAMGAVLTAQRIVAAGIIVLTTNLKCAQVISKYRPRCPILAVTRFASIARQLHLWRGIIPLLYEDHPDNDWQTDVEMRVAYCTKWALLRGFMRVGDLVVVVSGWRHGSSHSTMMRIHHIE